MKQLPLLQDRMNIHMARMRHNTCSIAGLIITLLILGTINTAAQSAPPLMWEYAYDWDAADATTIDHAYDMQPTPDGGYIIAGNNWSYMLWDDHFRVLKIDASGAVTWDREYGEAAINAAIPLGVAQSVCNTADGGYAVIGTSVNNDILMLKLDNGGNIQWHRILGGSGIESAGCIRQTNEGDYIISGYTSSGDGDVSNHVNLNPNDPWGDLWLVRLNSSGQIIWERTFGSSSDEGGAALTVMPDGGFVVCGYAGDNDGDISGHHGGAGWPDAWIIKVSATGTLEWQRCLGSTGTEHLFDIRHTADNGFIAVGYNTRQGGDIGSFNGGYRDAWVVKLDPAGQILWERSIGGSGEDMAGSVVESSPGKYVIVGHSNSSDGDVPAVFGQYDIWAVQLDAAGDIVWKKTLGGTRDDGAINSWRSQGLGITVVQGHDKGLTIAAATMSPGIPGYRDEADVYIIKLEPELQCDTTSASRNIEVCTLDTAVILSVNIHDGAQYRWNTGAGSSSISVNAAGIYTCKSLINCNVHTDTFIVAVKPDLLRFTLEDRTACIGNSIQIQASIPLTGVDYLWSTGATTPEINVKEPGIYTLRADNGCTAQEAFATVDFVSCTHCLFVPNAFSPDGNGLNDAFRVITRCPLESYQLQIFNRWGQNVFSSNNIEEVWDGTFAGKPCEMGVYFYTIAYRPALERSRAATISGDLTLVR